MRLQMDVMNVECILVARTDSEAATLITTNIDPRDHAFILGVTNAELQGKPLAETMNEAEEALSLKQNSSEELEAIESKWIVSANLKLYSEIVSEALLASKHSPEDVERFLSLSAGKSYAKARSIAQSMGVDPFWDWDLPRTREGFYRYQGGTKCAINRGVAFAAYADLIWMETKKPIYAQAKEFAAGVLAKFPTKMLAYNLSPSFNWDAAGMTDGEIQSFICDLGKLGFVWQFITLAGFHANSLGIDMFARDFAVRGMAAYVEGVQRRERENSVETLHHQTWSGANYYDAMIKTVMGGVASTAAMGKENTEKQQFSKK